MSRKAAHDAAAYIRSLAQLRGRNAGWAERAVREAASPSATEALNLKVIDYVAADVPELLKQVNNRQVSVLGRGQVLDTASATFRTVEPDWRTQLLAAVTNPSVAYILMLIGIYGLFFELSNPGYWASTSLTKCWRNGRNSIWISRKRSIFRLTHGESRFPIWKSKHVGIDESMIRAIARQAEAERERRAKVIHAEGELRASCKLMQAAQTLPASPAQCSYAICKPSPA